MTCEACTKSGGACGGKAPIPQQMAELAVRDPILALGLMMGIPFDPIAVPLVGTFNSFTVGQNINCDMQSPLGQRSWVHDIQYSLSLPRVFNGTIAKPQYDAYLRQHPGVSAQVFIAAGPKYNLAVDQTPLENIGSMFTSRWANGWQLQQQQKVRFILQLTDAPPSTSPEGPPYIVTVTLQMRQFRYQDVENVKVGEARERLRKLGFWQPDCDILYGNGPSDECKAAGLCAPQ